MKMEKDATQVEPGNHNAFQFSPIGSVKTASLSAFVKLLDGEVQKLNAEPITSRTLKRTLDFLKRSIGVDISTGSAEIPMSTLRTVRLLFLADLNSDKNVFRLLAPPDTAEDATMEFSTVTTTPRDTDAQMLITTLCDSLAMEIEPSKLRTLSLMFSRGDKHSLAEELLLHIEYTNDEVFRVLQETFGTERFFLRAQLSR